MSVFGLNNYLSSFLCIFLCVHVYGGQKLTSSIFLDHSTVVFATSSVTEPGAHQLSFSGSQWAPGILLFLHPHTPELRLQICTTTVWYRCWGIWAQILVAWTLLTEPFLIRVPASHLLRLFSDSYQSSSCILENWKSIWWK